MLVAMFIFSFLFFVIPAALQKEGWAIAIVIIVGLFVLIASIAYH